LANCSASNVEYRGGGVLNTDMIIHKITKEDNYFNLAHQLE